MSKRLKQKLLIFVAMFGTIFLVVSIFLIYAFNMKAEVKEMYEKAVSMVDNENKSYENYITAIDILKQIGNYKDSFIYLEKATDCVEKYEIAKESLENGDYELAISLFTELDKFANSEDKLKEAQYKYAIQLYEDGEYDRSYKFFCDLTDYEESNKYAEKALLLSMQTAKERVYNKANEYFNEKKYDEAWTAYNQLGDYENSQEMLKKCEDAIRRRKLASTISGGVSFSVGLSDGGRVVSTVKKEKFVEWDNLVSISNFNIYTIGLKEDGTVVLEETGGSKIDLSEWTDIVQVAAGERYIIGLKNDGTVIGAGHDLGDGQLKVDNWRDIIMIATGWRHTVGVDKDGKIYITGHGDNKQLNEIEANKDEWTDIIAIAAGGGFEKGTGHTVGLKNDGTVVAVGDNTYGQCNVDSWTNIVAIAAGEWHTVGLCADGTVVATGNDGKKDFYKYENACSVEKWEGIVAIAAGYGYTIGLKSDGTVLSVGYNDQSQQTSIDSWENILIYHEWDKNNGETDTAFHSKK